MASRHATSGLNALLTAACAVLLAFAALAARAADLAVAVENASVPTLCAEEDNVDLRLRSEAVQSFRIEARHPSYIGTLAVDRFAADFTNCTGFAPNPEASVAPKRITLHETPEWQLVGYTFATFWRQSPVVVRVGDRRHLNIHLIQLWTRSKERAEEVLVLYPADGYWRARPLPPDHLRFSAYGSSFLVGPVELRGRPLVDLSEVVFDPEKHQFTLAFAQGGSGSLTLAMLDSERIALDIRFDQPLGGARPFAALRSMFVTAFNADVAEVAWRGPGGKAWRQQPIMDFTSDQAVELWAGRIVPSRHNTSAPDMIFGSFSTEPR